MAAPFLAAGAILGIQVVEDFVPRDLCKCFIQSTFRTYKYLKNAIIVGTQHRRRSRGGRQAYERWSQPEVRL